MHHILSLLLLVLLVACEATPTTSYKNTTVLETDVQPAKQEAFNQEKDSLPSAIVNQSQQYANQEAITYVSVPSFIIKLRLTAKVKKLLAAKKETLTVSLLLMGEKKKDAQREDEGDLLYLLKKEYAISSQVEELVIQEQISKEALAALQHPNYNVLITAYNGSQPSATPIFYAPPIQARIADLKGQTTVLAVSLLKNNTTH